MPGMMPPAQAQAPQRSDPTTLAREKLRQARSFMEQGRLDDAGRLVGEAQALHAQYTSTEDSPTRLLEEINRNKKDAKFLLGAARKALVNNQLDRAETLAKSAQAAHPGWGTGIWGDSPGNSVPLLGR